MKPATSDPLAQLTEIRAIMERSSRFLSLSGLSGVGAGVVALVGTTATYLQLTAAHAADTTSPANPSSLLGWLEDSLAVRQGELPALLGLAGAMVALALLLAAFFTLRRTRSVGAGGLWTAPARRLLAALAVPLAAGGLFCLALYLRGAVSLVVPGLLVFYGLALLNASKFTLDEIRWLGLTQMVLGLITVLIPDAGLVIFALGFGLGHIGYGLLMYNRYERPGVAGTSAKTPVAR